MALLQSLHSHEGQTDVEAIQRLDQKIALLHAKEDMKWRQRAKQAWYTLGDKNTKFFHDCASQHHKTNNIFAIKDQNGILVSRFEEMQAMFDDYFQLLFQSTNPSCSSMNFVLQKIPTHMIDDINSM